MTHPSMFERTVQETDIWMKEVCQETGLQTEQQAYAATKAVLQQLRDRLTVEEAAHLGAQLPTLIRGFYYEGWRPVEAPQSIRRKDEFLDGVRRRAFGHDEIDPERATRGVFRVLERHVADGEVADVRNMMPDEIKDLISGRA